MQIFEKYPLVGIFRIYKPLYFYNIENNTFEVMNKSLFIRLFFLGFFPITLFNGCSINEERTSENSHEFDLGTKKHVVFSKSPKFDWNRKKLEVSFEDAFEHFLSIDVLNNSGNQLGYALSKNNVQQGITIKLKVIDEIKNSEKINEIMLEPYDLTKGINKFTIGYNENKPYIIY